LIVFRRARPGASSSRLDVEALICDWCAYLAGCDDQGVLARVCEELHCVAAPPFTACACDEDVTTDALRKDPGGWARAGLLYGYPPVSTAALVGMGLGLPRSTSTPKSSPSSGTNPAGWHPRSPAPASRRARSPPRTVAILAEEAQ
jgi:hypothetical protein